MIQYKKTMNTNKLNKIFMTLILVVITISTTNAHIPGPDYIYQCPKCSNFLKKASNTSGNTFVAILYNIEATYYLFAFRADNEWVDESFPSILL